MKIPPPIKKLLLWALKEFGPDAIRWVQRELREIWARLFGKHSILILGPAQTGKSALVQFLTSGHPYKLVKGEKVGPDRTFGAVIIRGAVTVPEAAGHKIKRDLPGDPRFRELWHKAIQEVQPQGIIYMLDGRHTANELDAALEEIFVDVLPYVGGGFAALHVFLNFADKWATGTDAVRNKLRAVHDSMIAKLGAHPKWSHVSYDEAQTQLAVQKGQWPEVIRALKRFAADLGA